ncbi:MAG: hypothetical protein JWQ43_3695 [Glaciihabitans sp.]|nr:hypothetical protein [Glaciihabitans sp.]
MALSARAIRSLTVFTTSVGLVAAGLFTAGGASAVVPTDAASDATVVDVCTAVDAGASDTALLAAACDALDGTVSAESLAVATSVALPEVAPAPAPAPPQPTGFLASARSCLAALFPIDNIPATEQTRIERIRLGVQKIITIPECVNMWQQLRRVTGGATGTGNGQQLIYPSTIRQFLKTVDNLPDSFWAELFGVLGSTGSPAARP